MSIRADRLADAMMRKDLSTSALARKVGVTPPTISLILRGRTKHTRYARQLAMALEVSEDWLLGHSDDPTTDRTPFEEVERRFVSTSAVADFDDFGSIPMAVGYTLPNEFVDHLQGTYEKFGFFTIESNAMMPTLQKGDDVLVAGVAWADDPEAIWLVAYGTSIMFRRVLRIGEGTFRLIPDNPTSLTLDARDEELHIAGRVVWFARALW